MRKIIITISCFCIIFLFSACGAKDLNSNKLSPVGTYLLSSMVTDGVETPKEDIDFAASMGLICSLELKDDNTGILDLYGDKHDIEWNESEIIISGASQKYSFDGTTLVLESKDSVITFIKGEIPLNSNNHVEAPKEDSAENNDIEVSEDDTAELSEKPLEDESSKEESEVTTTQLYNDFFEPFAGRVGELLLGGFQSIAILDNYKVDITEGSEQNLWSYKIYGENDDYVTLTFYPVNIDDNPSEWIDQLSLITYSKGDKEISSSDNYHNDSSPKYSTWSANREPQKVLVESLDELKLFMFTE